MTVVRVLANLCSIVPGRVGGSEVYASRLLAAFASLGAGEAPDVEVEVASMAHTRASEVSAGTSPAGGGTSGP